MDIREFLDELYSMWAKTTGAEKTYWMPKEQPDDWLDDGSGGEYREPGEGWDLWSLNEEQNQELLGNLLNEVDANFITAIHGALPDLVRRTHEALDEADRLDEQRDEQENEKADLMVKILALESVVQSRDIEIGALKVRMAGHVETKKDLRASIRDLEDQVAQLNYELSKERGE
ncbi:hypothetical protein [Mycobacteroides chelonae]|uniref:hypothetical protein n=1 Tax=Mycobacteroides chelonae TaxID=1774 RepID=UPI000992CDBE|nr:hypothetical protein [Mycobacteroides chelonae]